MSKRLRQPTDSTTDWIHARALLNATASPGSTHVLDGCGDEAAARSDLRGGAAPLSGGLGGIEVASGHYRPGAGRAAPAASDCQPPAKYGLNRAIGESDARQLSEAEIPARTPGPIQFAAKLAGFWGLNQEDLAGLLGFGPGDTAYAAELLTGRAALHGRDIRDRIVQLFRIRESLHSLFRDLDVENEWLREPHELLEGKSPMSLMVGGSMEDLLLAREYVDEVAGS